MHSEDAVIAQSKSLKATRSRRIGIHRAVKKFGLGGRKSLISKYRRTLEVREDERVVIITAEVLDLADIRVVLEEGPPAILSIRGERQFNEVDNHNNVRILTNGLRRFEATVLLPPEVDTRTLDACFEGCLLVVIGQKRQALASR